MKFAATAMISAEIAPAIGGRPRLFTTFKKPTKKTV
jgi:hypothetical protein